MYALLLSVFVFGEKPPKVVMMPFVMTNERCEAMRAERSDTVADGMKIVSICYPLEGDKVESLRFSADAVLKGIVD
ncbi:MAG: hypothetical protein P0Y66_14860 [Candidatus Kaistia colombiensis]|nr:MAG: hypothetical protein P0Y66_14860 [Kaistia sp.]